MSIFLPDVRVGAAELFVTNSFGSGPVATGSYGATTDDGLRTLAGGQMSIQVEGYLAIQTDAAPPLVVESALAMRDMFAVVNEAPSGGAVTLQLRQGSTVFGSLTILFFLLAIGHYANASAGFKHFTGYVGIFCGFSAIYAGLAQVLNEVFGKVVLPLGAVMK